MGTSLFSGELNLDISGTIEQIFKAFILCKEGKKQACNNSINHFLYCTINYQLNYCKASLRILYNHPKAH